MSFIEFKNVTKTYKNVVALNNINLKLEKGKIYGLLGRNGAGKTTLLNILTNKIFCNSGDVLLEGESVVENDKAQGRIYCMVEQCYYPEGSKIKSLFEWSKAFYPKFDNNYALELAHKFNLNINKKVKELSTGYSSIYKIIISLACNADIIILDEPVLGLDANHRDLFYKELINKYSKDMQTIILSTHLVQEAANIIEEVIIIDEGKVMLTDTVENLLSQGFTVTGPAQQVDSFTKNLNTLGEDVLGGLKSVYVLENISKESIPQGLELSKIDLQKLFVHLTNKDGE